MNTSKCFHPLRVDDLFPGSPSSGHQRYRRRSLHGRKWDEEWRRFCPSSSLSVGLSSSSTQSPTRRLQTILRVPAFEDCVHAYLTLYWHSEIAATRVCVFGFVFEVYVNIVCSPWGENIWPPTSTSCKFPLSPPSHLVLQYLVPSVEEFGGFCRPHVEEFSSFMLSTEV